MPHKDSEHTRSRKELVQPDKEHLRKPTTKSYLMIKCCMFFHQDQSNSARMSALITSFQHCTGGFIQGNKKKMK